MKPLPHKRTRSLQSLYQKVSMNNCSSTLRSLNASSNVEIVSLKAELANRPKSPMPKFHNQPDKDREALLRSLQERIISLERQLQDK